ncbi:MAG: FapA family protein [Candidatus Glassbacteria bacterium]
MPDKDIKQPETSPQQPGAGFNAHLEVTRDGLTAYITLMPPGKFSTVTAEQIKLFLTAKGIKFGVREDKVAELAAQPRYDERVLIAQGVAPVNGVPGVVKYSFAGNEKTKVKAGEKIGEIIPPKAGQPGTNVRGEEIECSEPEKAIHPRMVNIELSGKDGDILVAKSEGYLVITDMAVAIEPFFLIDKVVDEYEAYVMVAKRVHEADFGSEDLRKFVKDNNIVYGLLETEFEEIFKRANYEQSILIARGQPVKETQDGEIKYNFEVLPHFSVSESGKVDFKELNILQNVKKGDKLAEVVPAVIGKEGCSVYGRKIMPREPKIPALPQGDNTALDPGNSAVLVAEIDGSVSLKGDLVVVDPVYAVKGDIDYSTGNIDFNGSVNVGGDVKSGFKIKAAGDVQIEGVVEDAEIEAGGRVFIKLGFIGRGTGLIQAKGDFATRYCVGQRIVAEGEIHISDYVMNSQVQTSKSFFAVEKNGLIAGGEVCALKGIEVNVVGNENYLPTSVVAGSDKGTIDSLRLKRAEVVRSMDQIKEINSAILKLNRRKLVKKTLPEDKQLLPQTLLDIKTQKKDEIDRLMAEIKEMEKSLQDFKEATVKVYKEIFPGAKVTICDRAMKITDGLKSVMFKYSEGAVVAVDLGEPEQPPPKPEETGEPAPE